MMRIYRILQYLSFSFCMGLIGCATFNPCYYYVGKNDDKAIEECTKIIDGYDPSLFKITKTALTYNNRGAAYTNKGLTDLALQDLNMATDLNPDLALPYFNRGSVYFKLRRYNLAIAEYDKAKKLDSKFGDPTKYNTFNNEIVRAVLLELDKIDTPLHLAMIIGAVNNVYSSPTIEQWKEGTKSLLLSSQERYYAETLKNDPKFRLISREKVERVLSEQKLQNLGLTSTRIEFGQLIGATHLLIIDFTRYSSERSAKKFEDVVAYTLIEVKTGHIVASQVIRTLGV